MKMDIGHVIGIQPTTHYLLTVKTGYVDHLDSNFQILKEPSNIDFCTSGDTAF
jgi:hypothetical protein